MLMGSSGQFSVPFWALFTAPLVQQRVGAVARDAEVDAVRGHPAEPPLPVRRGRRGERAAHAAAVALAAPRRIHPVQQWVWAGGTDSVGLGGEHARWAASVSGFVE